MKQRPGGRPSSSEKVIRDIKRKTRKQYGAIDKIWRETELMSATTVDSGVLALAKLYSRNQRLRT
jgi:hypothetical protein